MILKNLKILATTSIVALSSCAFAAPSSPSAECTAGISNLLKLVARPEFFDEPPADFVSKSTSFLHIANNETDSKNTNAKRTTKIVLKKEIWLNEGDLTYISDNGSPARFSEANFSINPDCSPKHKDFLTLATKNIKGKFSESQIPEDGNFVARVWSMPDPEEDFERRIAISEEKGKLIIIARRMLSPDDVGE